MDRYVREITRITKRKSIGRVLMTDLKVGDIFYMEDNGDLVVYDNGRFIFRVDKGVRPINGYHGELGINVTPIA